MADALGVAGRKMYRETDGMDTHKPVCTPVRLVQTVHRFDHAPDGTPLEVITQGCKC